MAAKAKKKRKKYTCAVESHRDWGVQALIEGKTFFI